MFKKMLSKSLAAFLAVLMVVSCAGLSALAAEAEEEDGVTLTAEAAEETEETAAENRSKLDKIKELLNANSYTEYALLHGSADVGTDDVLIAGADFNEAKTTARVFTDRYLDSEEDVVLISESGDVSWDFDLNATGLYHVAITYAPVVSYDGDADG